MQMRSPALLLFTVLSVAGAVSAQEKALPEPDALPRVTFKSGVDMVTVSVSVRDRRGRLVRDLTRSDFTVLDSGERSEIRDFYAGESPLSLALLLDISGSMAVGGNIDRAREAVAVTMTHLRGSIDEAALFTFDSELRQIVGFTTDLATINRVSLQGKPWGLTSLYDAVAGAARTVAERANRHRALLVVTDGADTASRLTAREVSGIASSISVPVYLLTVASPVDHPGTEFAATGEDHAARIGTLDDLARWTGGDMHVASAPAHILAAAQDLIAELRHQYLISFEPGTRPGWHPLEIRTKNRGFQVHARGGYLSGPLRSGS
jgi:Ca-activated chloride channel family protein